MFEFHGWFGLAESTYEDDFEHLDATVDEFRTLLAVFDWPITMAIDLKMLNGEYFLTLTGNANRRREQSESGALEQILEFLTTKLPGSWGVLYERSDDPQDPAGPNHFRVRTLARGKVTERLDPWFSPCQPTIED